MNYMIILLNSRNSTLKFYNMLTDVGVSCSIISTPKISGFSCGICIKFEKESYNTIVSLLHRVGYFDFVGFYEIKKEGGKLVAAKI